MMTCPVYQGETTQTLQDYLLWQLDLTPFSDTDRSIALALIDAIDDYGYLTVSLDDILESFADENIELDEIEAVRKRVSSLIPSVWLQSTFKTALLLQLATYPASTPWLEEAKQLLIHTLICSATVTTS
ncbi:hypothetical protein N5E84_00055 [Vibrio sp. J502]|nr:hypothetical protein [Vibrio sp. J502]UXH28369.1 hypothetical protein N5E84_00055 [Vibrio sp. J502]